MTITGVLCVDWWYWCTEAKSMVPTCVDLITSAKLSI